MEEILASIRRIIADGEAGATAGPDFSTRTPPAAGPLPAESPPSSYAVEDPEVLATLMRGWEPSHKEPSYRESANGGLRERRNQASPSEDVGGGPSRSAPRSLGAGGAAGGPGSAPPAPSGAAAARPGRLSPGDDAFRPRPPISPGGSFSDSRPYAMGRPGASAPGGDAGGAAAPPPLSPSALRPPSRDRQQQPATFWSRREPFTRPAHSQSPAGGQGSPAFRDLPGERQATGVQTPPPQSRPSEASAAREAAGAKEAAGQRDATSGESFRGFQEEGRFFRPSPPQRADSPFVAAAPGSPSSASAAEASATSRRAHGSTQSEGAEQGDVRPAVSQGQAEAAFDNAPSPSGETVAALLPENARPAENAEQALAAPRSAAPEPRGAAESFPIPSLNEGDNESALRRAEPAQPIVRFDETIDAECTEVPASGGVQIDVNVSIHQGGAQDPTANAAPPVVTLRPAPLAGDIASSAPSSGRHRNGVAPAGPEVIATPLGESESSHSRAAVVTQRPKSQSKSQSFETHAMQLAEAEIMPPPGGGAKSLEDAVKEMLRPMLRQWLNENMPRIIEKVAQEEITARAGNGVKD